MEIILLKYVENLGITNELVNVKPGYARNYLIPQGFAVESSQKNKNILSARIKTLAKKEQEMLSQISEIQKILNDNPIKVHAKTGTSGKIFGSITSLHLVKAIADQKGYEIDRRKIKIEDEVKDLGEYNAVIDFGQEKTVKFVFIVEGIATEL